MIDPIALTILLLLLGLLAGWVVADIVQARRQFRRWRREDDEIRERFRAWMHGPEAPKDG